MLRFALRLNIFILILFINFSIAFSKDYPSYKEVRACYEEEIGCEIINKYKIYQTDEIQRIIKTDNMAYKISAGIQLSNNDSGRFLWQMINSGAKEPAVFSAFLSICIMQNISENDAYNNFSNFDGYSKIIKSFIEIAPNNSLPYYLEAFFRYSNQDLQNANYALIEASNIQHFTYYSKEIYHYSTETSEFLSYPKYIALEIALDNAVIACSPLIFKRLADLVFQQNNPSNEIILSVFHLGEQIENNSFMLISKLVGNSLKMRSLEYQGKNTDELQKSHTSMLDVYNEFLPLSQNFDEIKLYLYFDKVLQNNELEAMQFIINNP